MNRSFRRFVRGVQDPLAVLERDREADPGRALWPGRIQWLAIWIAILILLAIFATHREAIGSWLGYTATALTAAATLFKVASSSRSDAGGQAAG